MTCPDCNGVGYSDGRNSRYAAYFELCATCGATGELPQQLPQTENLAEPGQNAIVTGVQKEQKGK